MHRVRYISGVIARQLSEIKPSIVSILIEEEKDRPTWSMGSMVFVNDNQALAHHQRIKELPKPDDFNEVKKAKEKERSEILPVCGESTCLCHDYL